MEDKTILKLSNKKMNKKKLEAKVPKRVQVQTQLIDSMSQRMNLEEENQSGIFQNPSSNSNQKNNIELKQQNKSFDDSKYFPKTPESNSKNSQIAYNEGSNNEIIYDNNGEPIAINNNFDNSNVSNKSNQEEDKEEEDEVVGVLPFEINCPSCNNKITTNAESSCSCSTFFLIILMILSFPIVCILSLCRAGRRSYKLFFCCCRDDQGCCDCCNDVTHTCPKCGKIIAVSDSCSRICSHI